MILCDHQNLWKECISVFQLLHEDIHGGKMEAKFNAAVWIWSGVPRNIRTCLDLSYVILFGLGVVWPHQK